MVSRTLGLVLLAFGLALVTFFKDALRGFLLEFGLAVAGITLLVGVFVYLSRRVAGGHPVAAC